VTRLVPYLLVLAFFLPFNGMSQNQLESASTTVETEPIAIGLLLPDNTLSEVIDAAQLAINRINAAGGYKNHEFKLLIRTTEGFWGAGSKESVSLVYEDQVRVIIGSLDGRNGHLAEQVAAKSHITYIETYATDPTLSQAFVPWFMRVVPNDNQQAATILNQIERNGGGPVGILSTENYDARYAVTSLSKAVVRETGKTPLVLDLDSKKIHQDDVIKKVLGSNIDHLVIPFDALYLKDLIKALREENPDLLVYGTLHFSMGLESRKDAWGDYEGMFIVAPWFTSEKNSSLSGSRSAYTYDAVNMVIRAIQQVGTDRVAIKDYISKSEFSKGATGTITFDDLGNRLGASTLIRIQDGVVQSIKKP